MKRVFFLLACLFRSVSVTAQPVSAPLGLAVGAVPKDANGFAPTLRTYSEEAKMRYICGSFGSSDAPSFVSGSATNVGETSKFYCMTTGPIDHIQLFMPFQYTSGGIEILLLGTYPNALPNTVFHQASIEYPLNKSTTSYQPPFFTQGGNTWMQTGTNSVGAYTDIMTFHIPANTLFAVWYYTAVAVPPASASVAVAAGGALTAGTYYYRLTCTKFGSESGQGTEVSGTTSGSNLTLNLTITASTSSLGCDTYNIYRATTSGSETYLTAIPAKQLYFSDNGSLASISTATPPSQPRYLIDQTLHGTGSGAPYYGPSWYTNTTTQGVGGSGADYVGSTGQLAGGARSGAYSSQIATPKVLADDTLHFCVCGLGDSIMAGSGILPTVYQSPLPTLQNLFGDNANWFDYGLEAAHFYLRNNIAKSGTQATVFTGDGVLGSAERWNELQNCQYVISDLSVNDLHAAEPWYQLAETHYHIGSVIYNRGHRYFITTLGPYVTSTDNMLTTGNQTPSIYEAQRLLYNAWIRAGMLFRNDSFSGSISGNTLTEYGVTTANLSVGEEIASGPNTQNMPAGFLPVPPFARITTIGSCSTSCTYTINNPSSTTVTTSAMTGLMPVTSGGSASRYIANGTNTYFDLDNAIGEVNVNNVATPNGGYYPAPCATASNCQVSAIGTGILTGTPTTSSLPYTSWSGSNSGYSNTQYALIPYLVRMTSGAAVGQTCLIASNTTSVITCSGNNETLSTAPAAGDTFSVWQTDSQEGIHPTIFMHFQIAAAFQTWATANLVPF